MVRVWVRVFEGDCRYRRTRAHPVTFDGRVPVWKVVITKKKKNYYCIASTTHTSHYSGACGRHRHHPTRDPRAHHASLMAAIAAASLAVACAMTHDAGAESKPSAVPEVK